MRVSIEEISKDLPAYLQRVQAGESFVVLQGGKPIAEVIPPKPEGMSERGAEFLESLKEFQERLRAEEIDLDPDEIFKDVRDRTPAPEEPRW
ncbi:hypothetical protein [Phormidesmis priestleyi]